MPKGLVLDEGGKQVDPEKNYLRTKQRREPNKEAHTITRCKQIHPTLDQQQQAQFSVKELTTSVISTFMPSYVIMGCMHAFPSYRTIAELRLHHRFQTICSVFNSPL
jgi:hypothetical protein